MAKPSVAVVVLAAGQARIGLAAGGRAGKTIINKRDIVTNEDLVLNGHSFTNETVAADLAAASNLCALLYFDERANLGVVANFAAVQVRKTKNPNSLPQLNIRSNLTIIGLFFCHWN